MNIRKLGCCLSSLALIAGLIACGNDISETNPSTQADRQSQIPVQTPGGNNGGSSGAVQSEIGPPGMTSQSSGGSTRAIVSFTGVKVEKSTAQNGYTVGELYAEAVNLNDQKVTVKGRVVKISPNIMGKNWLHIQDGTGDPTTNTHDLVVTSSAMVEKGTIISLEGVLAAGKDFGFGYRYDVLIEDAVVVK